MTNAGAGPVTYTLGHSRYEIETEATVTARESGFDPRQVDLFG